MVKYPTILHLPQEDINRQLYTMVLKLQKENKELSERVKALEDAS